MARSMNQSQVPSTLLIHGVDSLQRIEKWLVQLYMIPLVVGATYFATALIVNEMTQKAAIERLIVILVAFVITFLTRVALRKLVREGLHGYASIITSLEPISIDHTTVDILMCASWPEHYPFVGGFEHADKIVEATGMGRNTVSFFNTVPLYVTHGGLIFQFIAVKRSKASTKQLCTEYDDHIAVYNALCELAQQALAVADKVPDDLLTTSRESPRAAFCALVLARLEDIMERLPDFPYRFSDVHITGTDASPTPPAKPVLEHPALEVAASPTDAPPAGESDMAAGLLRVIEEAGDTLPPNDKPRV